jgi:nucleoside 2-deoxyribosyltransferase
MEELAPPVFSPKSIRVFISHSHHQKHHAANVKYVLQNFFGLEVFVAHDDIEPTKLWEDQIIEELQATDVILAILTEEFKASKFTDQEIGYGLALKKYIIPVKVALDPYGFLGKFQAMSFKIIREDWPSWISHCEKIIALLEKQEQFKGKTIDLMIKALRGSNSYEVSNRISRLLWGKKLTSSQISEIFNAFLYNDQVSGGFDVPRFMDHLIQESADLVGAGLIEKYKGFSV